MEASCFLVGARDWMEQHFSAGCCARLRGIKAYILAQIDNPALCLADVAAQQRISSSYVRKLFSAERTTFTKYTREIRLENVFRLLSDRSSRSRSISTIALSCGFNDISYFNRAFRHRYGFTPSDLRFGRALRQHVEA